MIGKNGMLTIGSSKNPYELPKNRTLRWFGEDLKCIPVTCCTFKDNLIVSDGFNCWLWNFSFDDESKIVSSKTELSFHGIINLISKKDNIMFVTTDGNVFYEKIENLKSVNKQLDLISYGYSIPNLMSVLQKCSKQMDVERQSLEEINNYLQQLTLLHQVIIDKDKKLFIIDHSVEPNYNKGVFTVNVKLTFNNETIKIKQDWFQIRVTISNAFFIHHSFSSLKDVNSQSVFNLAIDITSKQMGKILNFTENHSIKLKCDIILKKFDYSGPFCCVNVSNSVLYFTDFLCPFRMKSDFRINKYQFSQNESIKYEGKHDIDIFCKRDDVDRHLKFIDTTKLKFSNNFDNKENSVNYLVWFLNHPIHVVIEQLKDNNVNLNFSSSNVNVLLCLKQCLFDNLINKSNKKEVKLTPNILRKVYLFLNLVNLQSDAIIYSSVIKSLYKSFTHSVALIPK